MSVDMMTKFLHTILSLDTAVAKVDTEVHSAVVLGSKVCTDSLIKDTGCLHRRRMISMHPLQRIPAGGSGSSSSSTPLLDARERQAPTCPVTLALDLPNLLNTSNNMQVVLPVDMVAYPIPLAGLQVDSKDRIMALGTSKPANMVAVKMRYVGLASPRDPAALAQLLEPALDQRSTICKARVDFRRVRIRVSRTTGDTPGI